MKKVNLAHAMLHNKNCYGFIWKYSNGKYGYQNDNDLGLDLDPINFSQSYIRKVFVDNKHYVYQLRYGASDDGRGTSLKTVCALLKECHAQPLTSSELLLTERYWSQFSRE